MHFILAAAAKDVRRRLADPAAIAVWIGIPLLLSGLLHLVSGGGGDPNPRSKVLVVDRDDTLLSGLVLSGGTQGRLGELIELEPVSEQEGQRRINDGEASALIILPAGFQQGLLLNQPTEVTLITNPAETIRPAIVEQALEVAAEGVFYAQRLFGEPIRQIVETATPGGPTDADVASISVAINQRLAGLQNVLIPPVMNLQVTVEQSESQPDLNFGQLFLPGMLFMSFLFIALGMSVDVWIEKTNGTLARIMTTPQSATRFLVGKLAAGAVMMSAVALAGLLAAVALFDLHWTRVPVAFFWSIFAGGALLALLTLVQTFATSARTADMLAGVIIFPLMMIGGSFFPFEAMPSWMAAVGQWTPNGQAVMRLKDLLYGTPSALTMAGAATAIGVPALAALLLAARRLRGRFAIA